MRSRIPTLSSLGCVAIVLIAIIVDPTAPVYSFQSAPATVEDAAGTPTAATTSMPRQRLRCVLGMLSSSEVEVLRST